MIDSAQTSAALILAGGQSRRMGCDKALLALPTTETLLQRTCSIAQACVSQTYVLTPWPERYQHLLPASVKCLQEGSAQAGPMVALDQGWSMILADAQRRAPDWLLVLACDLPALEPSILQAWQRKLATISSDAIAALPQRHHRWEPLCGFYHRRCIPSLQRAVAANIHSFQQWLADEVVTPLALADENMLQNCNTPAQWQQFLDSMDNL